MATPHLHASASAAPSAPTAAQMASLDWATTLVEIGPGKFKGEFVPSWDRWDGNAQGGYIKSYITKALIQATGGKYPHPVQISTDYLDSVKIGIPSIFVMEILRSGKRFAYLRGTVSQNEKLLIATSGVLAAPNVDLAEQTPFPDLGTPNFRAAPGKEVVPEPEDCPAYNQAELMGRERGSGAGNFFATVKRPMMFNNLHRSISPIHRESFLKWRDNREKSDAAGVLPSDDGSTHETWGWANMTNLRPHDALSCALWADNFPPLALQSWRGPNPNVPSQGSPGWTTLSLSIHWVRAVPEDNGPHLLLRSTLESCTPTGRCLIETCAFDRHRRLVCVARQVALLVHRDWERAQKEWERMRRRGSNVDLDMGDGAAAEGKKAGWWKL
ncbi:hypothetical protein M427DRAFT_136947 [Gonapodya prolifera JEL478]|uniref:Thioesterase family protein n=1 Tax=Gonapodya prolifera (strain JEL478) TaxID=1344416 RepID=A0A139A7L7_GONPJ|nr:hypothetical protein M427DRAFT_136947 [Gonapodya prolifera JEL478]|eukprot:KXS12797.1 hypothetical protein M427DRAFT_136947 [Gonapodya prolifera JEL478]